VIIILSTLFDSSEKAAIKAIDSLQQSTYKSKCTPCVSAVEVSFVCALPVKLTIPNHNCSLTIIFRSWLFSKGAPNKVDSLKKHFKLRL